MLTNHLNSLSYPLKILTASKMVNETYKMVRFMCTSCHMVFGTRYSLQRHGCIGCKVVSSPHEMESTNMFFPHFNQQHVGHMDVSQDVIMNDSQLQTTELAPFINLDRMKAEEHQDQIEAMNTSANNHPKVSSCTIFTDDGKSSQDLDLHGKDSPVHECNILEDLFQCDNDDV